MGYGDVIGIFRAPNEPYVIWNPSSEQEWIFPGFQPEIYTKISRFDAKRLDSKTILWKIPEVGPIATTSTHFRLKDDFNLHIYTNPFRPYNP